MKLEEQSSCRGVPRRKGRSCFAFLICFHPSPVYDSDHAASSDRSQRLFCFAVRKKKKKKKKSRKKAVQAHAPAKAGFKPLLASDESKDRDVDNNNDNGRRVSNYDVDFNSEKTDHSQTRTDNDQAQSSPNRHFESKINNDLKLHGNIASRIGKLDPSIGTGIMAITLAVMVFVGRSAAIVCLCSFLYIFGLVRISSSKDKRGNDRYGSS